MPVPMEDTIAQLRCIAEEEGAERLVLFGSRARGTNCPKSDLDIAVAGCPSFSRFADRVENELWTLFDVDIVNCESFGSSGYRDVHSRVPEIRCGSARTVRRAHRRRRTEHTVSL